MTEAHVRRRLALASLPCPVLDALKAGDISFGIAQAMTISTDEKKILEVLELAIDPRNYVNEHKIKSILNPDDVSDQSREAQFVGVDAYTAEGGSVTKDLFNEEVLLNNPDILERLFAQKLDDAAAELQKAEGWAWVMITEDSNPYGYEVQQEHSFARVYKEEGVLTEAQDERFEEMDNFE